MRSGKIEFETLAKILLLTAFLIIVLLLFKGCMDAYNDLGSVGIRDYTCWATNVMRENVVSIWPSTCRNAIVKDPADMKRLGQLMGTCWWMYGQGKWDLGAKQEVSVTGAVSLLSGKDVTYDCYAFQPKEDIKIDELKDYMEKYNVKGEVAKKVQNTMWNYLQTLSKGDNICFDKNDAGILKKGGVYYIKFVDNRAVIGAGESDLLLISGDKDFFGGLLKADSWIRELFSGKPCYAYGTTSTETRKQEAVTKQTTDFFYTLIDSINKCGYSATQKCRCGEINFGGLPQGAYIRIEGSEPTIITLYYNNKEIDSQPVSGKIIVTGEAKSGEGYRIGSVSETFYLSLNENYNEIEISSLQAAKSYPAC